MATVASTMMRANSEGLTALQRTAVSMVALRIASIPASPIIVRKRPIWVGSHGRRGSRLWVFKVHPAEVLPDDVLRSALAERRRATCAARSVRAWPRSAPTVDGCQAQQPDAANNHRMESASEVSPQILNTG